MGGEFVGILKKIPTNDFGVAGDERTCVRMASPRLASLASRDGDCHS